ncbi:hypothetical protein ACFWP3_17030 [Streptomyces sp. NPDC058525]|uniref:hypothetical protein n=1 Tax=Streptomyces sp. NPDC058525 TaxID=3346538 RepID=UPI0036604D5F
MMTRSRRRREKLRAAAEAAQLPQRQERLEGDPSPVRALADQMLAEPPPSCPSAPYDPQGPPEWMVSPVPVFNGQGVPVSWTDEQPLRLWEGRRGQAAYELQREDQRDRLRQAGQGYPEQPWAGYRQDDPTMRTNAVLNSLRNRLTVQQRENRTAPPKRPDEELPEAQCSFTPIGWWE